MAIALPLHCLVLVHSYPASSRREQLDHDLVRKAELGPDKKITPALAQGFKLQSQVTELLVRLSPHVSIYIYQPVLLLQTGTIWCPRTHGQTSHTITTQIAWCYSFHSIRPIYRLTATSLFRDRNHLLE